MQLEWRAKTQRRHLYLRQSSSRSASESMSISGMSEMIADLEKEDRCQSQKPAPPLSPLGYNCSKFLSPRHRRQRCESCLHQTLSTRLLETDIQASAVGWQAEWEELEERLAVAKSLRPKRLRLLSSQQLADESEGRMLLFLRQTSLLPVDPLLRRSGEGPRPGRQGSKRVCDAIA